MRSASRREAKRSPPEGVVVQEWCGQSCVFCFVGLVDKTLRRRFCVCRESQRLEGGMESTGNWWCELFPDQASSTFHTGNRIVRGGGFVWWVLELRKSGRVRILSLKATVPQPRPQLVWSRPPAYEGVFSGRSAGELPSRDRDVDKKRGSCEQGSSPPKEVSLTGDH